MAGRSHRLFTYLVASLLMACGGIQVDAPREAAPPPQPATGGRAVYGKAAWYGARHHGRRTASGESFDKNALTAAHRTLPFETRVRVTNLANGRQVMVRINDRGPYGRRTRIIDLSEAAARRLGMIRAGSARVRLEVLR